MRSKRLRRFRRQFPVAFFLVKLTLIWYLVVFSISYLTSGTAAQFFDKEETESTVKAGFWADGRDGSSLSFIEQGNTNIKGCDPVEITAEIQNSGEGDMVSGSTYDVYYVENGNPEKHGEKLDLPEGEGDIPALKRGDSTELKHNAQKPGVYAFLAKQPEGHTKGDTIWSKWVIINCPPGKAEEEIETETESTTEPETEKEQRPDTDSEEGSNEEKEKNNEESEKETANNEEDDGTGTAEEQDEDLTEIETEITEETGEDS